MARSKKPQAVRLTHQIIFRVRESDYVLLSAEATRAGLHPNELARRLTLVRSGRLIVNVTRKCDPAYIAQIRAIGINLNQLAKNSHIFNRLTPRLEALCDEIRRVVLDAAEDHST